MSEEVRQPEEPEKGRPEWTYLHLWQIQPIRDLLLLAGLLLLLLLGERASIVTVPIALAFLLAYLVEPVMRRITRGSLLGRKVAAGVFVILGLLLVVVPLFLGVGFAVVQGVQMADHVATGAEAVIQSVGDPKDEELRDAIRSPAFLAIRDFIVKVELPGGAGGEQVTKSSEVGHELENWLGLDTQELVTFAKDGLVWLGNFGKQLASQLVETGAGVVGSALSTLGSLGSLVFMLFLTAFFFFFVSTRWNRLTELSQGLLPEKNRERTVEVVAKMDGAISGFVRGRVVVALILGVFYTISFALLGVPAPLLLGPAIAFLSIFPYAAVLGLPVVIVLFALEARTGIQAQWWWPVLTPLLAYQIGQMIDDYVLTPKIQGDATGLDTPTILAASIAGGALLGLFGLLVAIPIAACVRILVIELVVPRYREWTEGRRRDFLPLDGE